MIPMTTYWIILAAGTLLSAGLFILSARLSGYSVLRAGLGFLLGFPLAYLFGKLVYIIIFSSSLPQGGNPFFRLRPEEFSFAAACAGFCLGPVLTFANRRQEIPGLMDQLAVPGCILAGAFRFGEVYLAISEAESNIGLMTGFIFNKRDLPYNALLDKFPWSVNLQRGTRIQVAPAVSTPAALVILLIAGYAALLWFLSRRKSGCLGRGVIFERCVFLLCAFRIFWEMFNARMKFFFVPVDQVLCALAAIAVLIRTGFRLKKAAGYFPAWPFFPLLLCLVINAGAQFFMDGKNYLLADAVIAWGNELLQDYRSPFPTLIMGLAIILLTCIGLMLIFGLLSRQVTRSARSKPQEETAP